jgi:UDP-glucuronate decarboxylase
MDTEDDFPGPLNIGNPNEFTILELAQKVIAMTGTGSSIDYNPLPSDDPIQRQPDISLAKEKLHWQPEIPLGKGLEKTIDYFQALLQKLGRI